MVKKLTFTMVLGLALISCTEDLGNYKYHDLNEIEISGIDADISVLTNSRLQLAPVLTPALSSDEAYTFEWKAITREDESKQNQTLLEVVLGTTRNLDYNVTLPAEAYNLYYTVTEKSTGVFWRTNYTLLVSESTSEGWLVLCADGADDRVRLDIVSKVTNQTYTDFLKTNGTPTLNGPLRIQRSQYASPDSPFYLLSKNGATRVGSSNFEWKTEFLLQYEIGQGVVTQADCITDVINGKMMISDSEVYYADCGGMIGLFGKIDDQLKFAPFIGVNTKSRDFYVPVNLLYEIGQKRLMGYAPALRSEDVGSYKPLHEMNDLVKLLADMPKGGQIAGFAFKDFPVGLDFVYLENTKYDPNNTGTGMTYVILSDQGKRYLYGIQLGELWTGGTGSGSNFALGKAVYGDLSGCTDIDMAEHFAFSSLKNYMYYSVGGTVYRVDLTQDPQKPESPTYLPTRFTATQQIMLPGGEKITRLKFNQYIRRENRNRSYDLIVGSVSGEEGTLRIYEGFNSGGDFKGVTPTVHTGLGRIVDVTYREMFL